MLYLTFDQDWAPEWATTRVAQCLEEAGLTGTFFVTHGCKALDRLRSQGVELGWHPNFMAGSSHGDSIETVLNHLAGLVPDATGARAHCLVRGTPFLEAYRKRGLRYDAADLRDGEEGLRAFHSWTGVWRIPIFFEDDVHLSRGLPATLEAIDLTSPGLKVFSFHPVLLALNATSLTEYRRLKTHLAVKDVALTDAAEEDFAPFSQQAEPGVWDLFLKLIQAFVQNPDRQGGRLDSLVR